MREFLRLSTLNSLWSSVFLWFYFLHALKILCLYILGGMLRFHSGLIVFLAEAQLQPNVFFKALESSSVFTLRAYSKPTSAWQSGAYTYFSCFSIQIGKRTPPKSWILFNWVFAFLGAVGFGSSPLHRYFLAIGYILSPMRSLKKNNSFGFLCPLLGQSVESACC